MLRVDRRLKCEAEADGDERQRRNGCSGNAHQSPRVLVFGGRDEAHRYAHIDYDEHDRQASGDGVADPKNACLEQKVQIIRYA